MSTVKPSPPRRVGLTVSDGGRPRSSPPEPYPYDVGERIDGDLVITGHLAAGRVGNLYQVWSAREWCAFTCKILAPQHAGDRRSLAAMRRESRILRAVRHPNVIHCYGGGEHDGLPYILLEYLEGPTLFALLESRPKRRLEPADALRAAIHLGAALYHLHRKGYLHLDLKPSNLILRDGVPVLIDLDTARRLDGPPKPRRRMGTGPYMAPEQVRCGDLSAATDVYGLGALLYEMLTGRWPFEEVYLGNEERAGMERQFPQVGSLPPEAPSHHVHTISSRLERTLLRCLAADPRDRFPGMHPLLLALREELDQPESLWPAGVVAERRHEPRDEPPPSRVTP